ncbi:hypothetical protein ACFQ78_33580, partial [Streptomyces sp. NPDC056519]|uniref:hypothetical protein n=1 Tax=Streptomyces sp. NPDC056519 TaxID=3345849 RepID=UPI003680E472
MAWSLTSRWIINVRQAARLSDHRTWIRPSRDPGLSDGIQVFTKLVALADAFLERTEALLCAD